MDYSQLTDEELASLPPELLQEVLAEIQAKNANAEPAPPKQGEYSDVEIADSMHPDIGIGDRLIVKNLASSPDAGIRYLQKEYPNMQFLKTRDGEIVAKKANEPYFKRLDEKGTSILDVGDVVADVVQGSAEGVAGGLAGLSTMNPFVGALGAGAAGAISETAKQSLGEVFGIPNNMDAGNVALSGAMSGLIPGVGAGVKSAWGVAKNKVGPKVGSWLSGIPEDVIRNINIDKDARNFIANNGPEAYIKKYSNDVVSGLENANSKLGKEVELSSGNKLIDTTQFKSDMEAWAKQNLNPRQQSSIGYINDELRALPQYATPQQLREFKRFGQAIVNNNTDFLGKNIHDPLGQFSTSEIRTAGKFSGGARDLMRDNSPNPQAFDAAHQAASDFYTFVDSKRLKPFQKNDLEGIGKVFDNWNKKASDNADQWKKSDFKRLDDYVKLGGGDVDTASTARAYQSANIFNEPDKLAKQGKAYGLGSGVGGAVAYGTGGGAATGILATLGGGLAGGLGGSPYIIKRIGESAPMWDRLGNNTARYIYQNPYARGDKALFNLIQNENDR